MQKLKDKVFQKLKDKGMDVVGVASASRVNEMAPPGFTLEDQMPGAKSAIIFGRRHPAGIYKASLKNEYKDFYYSRAEWNCYENLDHIAYSISRFIEQEGGFFIPSHSHGYPLPCPQRGNKGKSEPETFGPTCRNRRYR